MIFDFHYYIVLLCSNYTSNYEECSVKEVCSWSSQKNLFRVAWISLMKEFMCNKVSRFQASILLKMELFQKYFFNVFVSCLAKRVCLFKKFSFTIYFFIQFFYVHWLVLRVTDFIETIAYRFFWWKIIISNDLKKPVQPSRCNDIFYMMTLEVDRIRSVSF